MSRPVYRGTDKNAREKLVDAFWDSLEAGTFSKLTVSGICKQTGLNRNSFYYYFEDIDSLARSVVEDTLEKDLPALMIAQSGKGAAAVAQMLDSPVYAQEFEHVCLVASTNSTPVLQSMLKAALSQIWCNALGISPGKLDNENRAIFEFCLGGVLSLLAFKHDAKASITMGEMLETGFARNMFASISQLAGQRETVQ